MRLTPTRPQGNLAIARKWFLSFSILFLTSLAFCQVQVLTEHNDVTRSGANVSESYLTPANVNFSTFGKLFTQTVDGYVVGQPLYLSAVSFPNGMKHNVVYVTTQHDSVFAFDADSYQAPLWSVSFINPAAGITPVPISDYGCGGTGFTEIGIVSTPVIDPVAGTIFVLAKTLENGAYIFRLHSLSVSTGADVIPGVVISASVPNAKGFLQFNPSIQMQRPGLLLENGTIYIGFGSNGCDTYSFNGWLLAYNESLQQTGAFATTPNGLKGAIWQGGGGPAADNDGTIFLATGNGTFDANTGGSDYGDSVLHLSPASSGLKVLDYFTPYDEANLFKNDLDLGSGGVVLLPDQDAPHTHEILGGGKEGTLYLVDRDTMGGYNSSGDTQIIQSIPKASAGEIVGVPAYWNGNVYIDGQPDHIKAFSLGNDLLSLQPTSETTILTGTGAGSLSVSAEGNENGILWALPQGGNATLYAFNATNLATELYSSAQAPNQRDKVGNIAKFIPPTIANGKVYIGGTTALSVFGLLPTLSPSAGNNQAAFVWTTLPTPLQLKVVDAYQGNPIAGVPVTCKDGGVFGVFSATMPMVSNSQGIVTTNYTVPKKAQTVTITCTASGFVGGKFSETGIAGPVSRELVVSGNYQTGPVSTPLPNPFVVQVLDPYGYGVPGMLVTFSDGGAGGSFTATSIVTNNIGEVSTYYTTPGKSGKVTATATTSGIAPAKITVTVQ